MSWDFAQMLRGHVWGQGFPEPRFLGSFKVEDQRVVGGDLLVGGEAGLSESAWRMLAALVAVASQMLSSLSHLAGVVTIPRQPHQSLSQIEFLPLSENRVLVVMVINGRDVQNRIVHLERYYPAEELRRAANFLNQQFAGKELRQVREDLVGELKAAQTVENALLVTMEEGKVLTADMAGGGREPSPSSFGRGNIRGRGAGSPPSVTLTPAGSRATATSGGAEERRGLTAGSEVWPYRLGQFWRFS